MTRLKANLSLDLDDRWAYLKARGDAEWASRPSYFGAFIPAYLDVCQKAGVTSTIFIVGRDAAMPEHHALLQSLTEAGHEVGNHSYNHEPWMQGNTREQIASEIAATEQAIFYATGERPIGWRGPGFCSSPDILSVLQERGYLYDGSSFPTFLGPLMRLYYQLTAKPDAEQKKQLKALYGSWSAGFRPLHPYQWATDRGPLLEIPVTTFPMLRSPIHGTYLACLAQYSPLLAKTYFLSALTACRLRGVEPSFLLHPLDFMGSDEAPGLEFFPAMKMPSVKKRELMTWALSQLAKRFDVQPMGAYAKGVLAKASATASSAARLETRAVMA